MLSFPGLRLRHVVGFEERDTTLLVGDRLRRLHILVGGREDPAAARVLVEPAARRLLLRLGLGAGARAERAADRARFLDLM